MLGHTPIGRFEKPEDVNGLIVFLCSDEAGFINGAAINIGGGIIDALDELRATGTQLARGTAATSVTFADSASGVSLRGTGGSDCMNADDVETVAVVGAGTMGPGMAATFARYGYPTALFDIKQEQIEKAKGTIDFVYKTLIGGGFATEEEAATGRANLTYTGDLAEAVGEADFVVETVPERLEIKKAVFAQLTAPPNRGPSWPPTPPASRSRRWARRSRPRTGWSACTGRTRRT